MQKRKTYPPVTLALLGRQPPLGKGAIGGQAQGPPMRGDGGLRRRGCRPLEARLQTPSVSRLAGTSSGPSGHLPRARGRQEGKAQSLPRLEGGGRAKRGRGDTDAKEKDVSPSHPRSARATAPFRQGGHRRAGTRPAHASETRIFSNRSSQTAALKTAALKTAALKTAALKTQLSKLNSQNSKLFILRASRTSR